MLTKKQFEEGQVLLIDKPLTWTSFDAVKKIRNKIGIKKVGHAGTLDPLATGLLIICTGKFTKKINEFMGMPKQYIGTITIGSTTPTFDLESEPENHVSYGHITTAQIEEITKQFLGDILQYPPQHSAIKKNGVRLYETARMGIEVKVDPRRVTIYNFTITKIELPNIHFLVDCSTGTYIRSLANDFGKALGVGGYLSSLCRTKIGDLTVQNAQSMDNILEELQMLSK